MFNPIAARAVAAAAEYASGGPAVDFGNQRYDAVGIVPGTEEATTAAEFFLACGFSEYVALDINTARDAMIADLNEPVDLGRRFALIANNGTGEHLFDQARVFRNMHDLADPDGGVLLNVLPFGRWVNHGFYNYHPILFRDLVAANGYSWNFLWLANRDGEPVELPTGRQSPAFIEKRPEELIRLMDALNRKGEIYLVACFSREGDGEFRVPLQGKYVKDIDDAGLRERYG